MTEPRARPTILVIDDEPTNRALLRAYLARNHDVLEAEDGRKGLELFRATSAVDLVLLDVMMPDLSGYETCRELKRLASGYVPVILLSALNDQADRNQGLEAGADDFVSKPFDRHELLLRVRAFVELRRQDETIRRQVRELREVQELKDDLVQLVVHDLRNPLSGVIGFLELLQERGRPEDQRFVQSALGAARKVVESLDDVLTVRTLEEKELTIRREPVVVGVLAREAAATLEGAARAKGITIETAPAETVALLDRALVRRAIENVLANALKYSRSGQKIEIAVRPTATGVVIEVSDRGPGVPEEMKREIFEKFATVEKVRATPRRGFGLGLYLVKLVTLAHGGHALVRDRDGGGATFELALANAGDAGVQGTR